MRIGNGSIQWTVIASQRVGAKRRPMTGSAKQSSGRAPRLDCFVASAPRNDGKQGDPMPGNRNIMFLIIGALIVVVGVLGYNLYQTKKQPEGLQINVGPNGLKIENK
jgi:hypothetical protein